ncbi:DNA-binding transcriptional regulator, AcrR family [Nocardioides scoriae]|uniref:DNA-binding transcriptional regulator, AcrR family n=1 Tax=Nocardioides scoriae TaxID=642780 RepID=A0A1H1R5G1_9ACTN|nr:TetR family transcriptional regulator [Nocardioides scoriae]SDS30870.1 DNA-binding transcriptional regulator, AcrR family [Nocardioides scoriae]
MSSPREDRAAHRAVLGATVRLLRRRRGLTLRELGDRLGVSTATMSGIETGKTGLSSDRLSELAEVLGVPVDQLLVATEPDQVPPASAVQPSAPSPSGSSAADADWRRYDPLEFDPALTGALSSFLEFGYHGATMRTIAERAGLSVPGLYHYYSSKQEMLATLLDLTMTDLRRRTEAARDEGRDVVERFANLVECLALYHTHRRELAFVGASEMRSLAPETHLRVAHQRTAEQRMVDAEVEAGVRSGVFATPRPHEASRAVVTMCTALAQWFRHDGPQPPEHVAALYVDFALGLVRATGIPAAPTDS